VKKSALVTFAVIAIVASFAATAMPSGDPPPQLGFLFAFRNPECSEGSACQGEFETTLLVIDGDKMRVVVNSPHLYLPRKSGFWEVGTTLPKTVSSVQPHADAQASVCFSMCWPLWRIAERKGRQFPNAELAGKVDKFVMDQALFFRP